MTIERIQLRRGTAQQWTETDPILGAAEIGVELGTPNKFKVGDGSSTWTELPYFTSGSLSDFIPASQKGVANGVATLDSNGAIPTGQLANLISSAPSTLDTLNELAAALADDPNFATTITTELANKADISHTHTKLQISDFSHTHTLDNISDVTATASEVNVLDGITASTTELNYTDGVTSSIQDQLNSKAPLDSPSFTGTVTASNFTGLASSASKVRANGVDRTIYVSSTQPSGAATGDIWIKTA